MATSEARCPDCDRVLATQADSDALAGDWPKTPAIWIRKCWRNFKPNDGCPLVPTRTTSLDYHVFNNVRDIQTTAALAASTVLAYNHSREDSARTPCPICAKAREPVATSEAMTAWRRRGDRPYAHPTDADSVQSAADWDAIDAALQRDAASAGREAEMAARHAAEVAAAYEAAALALEPYVRNEDVLIREGQRSIRALTPAASAGREAEMVAAAYIAAVKQVEVLGDEFDRASKVKVYLTSATNDRHARMINEERALVCYQTADVLRTLPPADARQALEAMLAEAREEGRNESAIGASEDVRRDYVETLVTMSLAITSRGGHVETDSRGQAAGYIEAIDRLIAAGVAEEREACVEWVRGAEGDGVAADMIRARAAEGEAGKEKGK